MSPDARARARADQHGHVPARQPRARRARSSRARRSTRRVVDADGVYRKTGPGARLHDASAAAIAAIKSHGADAHRAGRRARADLPRADGRGHGGDLPDHGGAQAPDVGQARRGAHRRALLAASRPARASATSARRRWPAARSASCATATASGSSSTATGWRARVDLVGDGERELGARGGRARAGRAGRRAPTSRPIPSCRPTRGCGRRCSRSSGGTWGGCVYDVDAIVAALDRGRP